MFCLYQNVENISFHPYLLTAMIYGALHDYVYRPQLCNNGLYRMGDRLRDFGESNLRHVFSLFSLFFFHPRCQGATVLYHNYNLFTKLHWLELSTLFGAVYRLSSPRRHKGLLYGDWYVALVTPSALFYFQQKTTTLP